ncbi:helix-turn-helix transcriptional regulator [Solwaraspora sp. WMMA2056]|uniref:helix-turn-helix domain-containing protein n=1 Tax=Solwaraspora sp. WMMA2056 TaxID=3015161 RepID=UPI00259B3BC2|nr:helix-turn-helix transcriptional regulator [Solwaraspora sp. WMMA2056]WJK41296.1 helix-turn-helix transcriptional regulator [Solwaraspora sp. WMMA2056]
MRTTSFGAELRRLRLASGLSLTELADRVHYSKGYLSKVERDDKPPSVALARRCETALDASDALTPLVPAPSPARAGRRSADPFGYPAGPTVAADTGGVPTSDHDDPHHRVHAAESDWVIRLRADGSGHFLAPGRLGSEFLDDPGMLGWSSPVAHAAAPADLSALFAGIRKLARAANPSVVLPIALAHLHTVRATASTAADRDRRHLVLLASRVAEMVGWMTQEAGDDRAALWWTDHAVDLALSTGDRELSAYALVRRGLMALYRGNAAQTIQLAQRAYHSSGMSPRIRWLAAQREAQGQALAGDRSSCLRALDRAFAVADQVSVDAAPCEQALGPSTSINLTDLVAGWCMYDLGALDEATKLLDREVARIPDTSPRARARFAVRRALAHAAAGNVEHSCAIIDDVLADVMRVSSATIRTDLHAFARTINRWHAREPVSAIQHRLVVALRGPSYG